MTQRVRTIVGMGEFHASAEPAHDLVSFALGSCVGVLLWDPAARVGGMLHAMLPDSTMEPQRARTNPAMFIDTGLSALFHACYQLGAEKQRIIVRAVGGAATGTGERDLFQIGKRNTLKLRELLWTNGVMLRAHDLGGRYSRTVLLDIGTGQVRVKSDGREYAI